MKSIFDVENLKVIETITERPEAANDAAFLKRSAASAPQMGDDGVLDPTCARTPLNVVLPQPIINALNLALVTDYLESEYYSRGLNTPGLIPNELRLLFARLLLNEVGHRETLITVLGSNAVQKPTFDFTGRGAVPDVFSNFSRYVALGHTFADNGVRAIKGQSPNVASDDFVLTTALRFHSVEARHAATLRRLNGEKAWIVLNQRAPNLPAAVQGVYNGEENTVQSGIDLVALTGFSAATVSEAFDEPLPEAQVRQNLAPFIV